jgi:hypothetical protein
MSPVVEKERRLREAQADDALADIRHQRRIISGLWQFKKMKVDGTGNKPCTRMRTLYNRFHLRMRRCASRYRAARNALLVLNPDGSWQVRLKELKEADIRGPGKDDDGTSNSRFEPSWIWLVPRVHSAPDMGESEEVLDDSMRVEWAKSQARKQRWEEEVLIIQEEMRRVIKYHEWRAQWWHDQGMRRKDANDATLDGIAAYAKKEAHLCECLARCCAAHWLPALKEKDIIPEWGMPYRVPTMTPPVAQCSLAIGDDNDDGDDGDDDDDDDGKGGIEEVDDEWEEDDTDDDEIIDSFEIDD